MGSYKRSYKSPNMGYRYSYPPYNPTSNWIWSYKDKGSRGMGSAFGLRFRMSGLGLIVHPSDSRVRMDHGAIST